MGQPPGIPRLAPSPRKGKHPTAPAPMPTTPRRNFLRTAATAWVTLAASPGWPLQAAEGPPKALDLRDRTRGLLLGSALGDAFGGPIEFQSHEDVARIPDPPKVWKDGETLDAQARSATAARLRLRPYAPLRTKPESYAMWNAYAAPGTVTDDTRHKLILLEALRAAVEQDADLDARGLAKAYLDWTRQPILQEKQGYDTLAADWLEEWQLSARWILGERDLAKARPPERMWQGLPTCCGQMTLLPLATIFPGQPDRAYLAAWHLGWFDNGFGKDLNAALVAGLATALITPIDPKQPRAAWDAILSSMRSTDPFGYGRIRWTGRAVDRWLDLALRLSREAKGEPARLFAALETEFRQTTKWEAQVPFVVTFACLDLAAHDPLAALQLSLEWGHDTDSYAALLGAFVGAVHGASLFPLEWRDAVAARLRTDLDFDLETACSFLDELRRHARTRPVVQSPGWDADRR